MSPISDDKELNFAPEIREDERRAGSKEKHSAAGLILKWSELR